MTKEIRVPDGVDPDDVSGILGTYASTDDAQIVSSDRLDTLESEIKEAKEAFAAVLSEESPQSADTLSRQDMDALTEPFRDDEGEIDVDTLRQEPETQTSGSTEGGNGDDNGGFDGDNVGFGTREELDTLNRKRTTFKNRGMDKRAGEIEEEMMDLVGAEDMDTLEKEVL